MKLLHRAAISFLLLALYTSAQTPDFSRDVQPILKAHCAACHSGAKPAAKLLLDSPDHIRSGGARGAAIVPGASANSLLLTRVRADSTNRMPPVGDALPAEKIKILADWVDSLAPAEVSAAKASSKHWAYVKPLRPALPKLSDPSWVVNPIDAFLLARLDKEALKPSAAADRPTLIRRLSLDLTGLPPTLDDVDAFVKDQSPDAYDRLVTRLLASPHYGERWARVWLDLARYADTHGFEKDMRRTMWKYRDWVINAFNSNMPFDRFTAEQLAGDMFPDSTVNQRIATGFQRNSMFNEEGGVDPEEGHWDIMLDRANTTATVWLGSTIGCAQCHNHKFDPFSQKEYYQFLAFFNNSAYTPVNYGDTSVKWTETTLDLPTPEQQKKREALLAELRPLDESLKKQTPALDAEQRLWEASLVASHAAWTAITPAKLTATGGSELVALPDGSVLAKGANPDSESYIVEGSTTGQFSAVRLEALPDKSLPRGGPGRDPYGNATVTDFIVEIASPAHPKQWTKVSGAEFKTDGGSIGKRDKDSNSLWFLDATREDVRLARQLLLVTDKPTGFASGTLIRVTLSFYSEVFRQGLGKFRLSATAQPKPGRVTELPHRLRTLLSSPEGKRTEQERKELSDAFRKVAPSLAKARKRVDEVKKQLSDLGMATALVMAEQDPYMRPAADLRLRGSFLSKGEKVFAATPAVLHPFPEDALPNRLGLAKWLTSAENPLTARVLVNRIWDIYFGRGIVETSEDFGSQGSRPDHPELLDWLAVELVSSGWDLKHLHRLIVTSNAYRQSSQVRPELLEKDPDNRLLARGARFRLEAEAIRDNSLAISGLLSTKIGGPSVFPYQPDGVWDVPYSSMSWTESKGEDKYRRGVYTFIRRSSPYPMMVNFDAPSREQCTVRRSRTNTPLQALNTLNDPAFFEMAQAFARRVLHDRPTEPDQARVTYAFRLATQREPTPQQADALVSWLARERKSLTLANTQKIAGKTAHADLAAWTVVANVLLNMDQTLTRE